MTKKVFESIILSALNEMDSIFTSQAFNKAAIKHGYPPQLLQHTGLNQYIKRYARLISPGGRTWQKLSRYIHATSLMDETKVSKTRDYSISESNDSKLEDAIQIVKQAGYKVSKNVTEWVEI